MWQAEVRIDLDAIRDNVATLRARTTAELMAVVKADGYGHGMLPSARAALAGGASWLGVATLDEGDPEPACAGIESGSCDGNTAVPVAVGLDDRHQLAPPERERTHVVRDGVEIDVGPRRTQAGHLEPPRSES